MLRMQVNLSPTRGSSFNDCLEIRVCMLCYSVFLESYFVYTHIHVHVHVCTNNCIYNCSVHMIIRVLHFPPTQYAGKHLQEVEKSVKGMDFGVIMSEGLKRTRR